MHDAKTEYIVMHGEDLRCRSNAEMGVMSPGLQSPDPIVLQQKRAEVRLEYGNGDRVVILVGEYQGSQAEVIAWVLECHKGDERPPEARYRVEFHYKGVRRWLYFKESELCPSPR